MPIKDYTDEIEWGIKVLPTHFKKGISSTEDTLYLDADQSKVSLFDTAQMPVIAANTLKKNYRHRLFYLEADDLLLVFSNDYSRLSHITYYPNHTTSNKTILGQNILAIRAYNNFFKRLFRESWFQTYLQREIDNILMSIDEKNEKNIQEAIGNIEVMIIPSIEFADEGIRPDKKNIEVSKIDVSRTTISIYTLTKRVEHGEININTVFQRKSGLWDIGTKSRLIETIILNLPLPSLYFDAANHEQWDIIDGLQRISTIYAFINNKFALQELYYLDSELSGKKYSDLSRDFQRPIEEYDLVIHIIKKGTPPEVKYKLFRSINTSALTLEPQEIRHALNQGKPANIVKDFADNALFRQTVNLSPSSIERMEDREFALRYLAFQITHYKSYKPPMRDFLDEAMTHLYVQPDEKIIKWKQNWDNTLYFLHLLFKPKVLFTRKMFEPQKEYPINAVLFETFMYAFSKLSQNKKEEIAKNPIRIDNTRKAIEELKNNQQFMDSINSSIANNKEQVALRFGIMEKFIAEINTKNMLTW